ncbi:MAG TPA: SDR family oxidoreductase [Nitrospira sp.]|jgi:NAD(P)-dependent dehydrogenase (short-subunit alcohol dehydrogenase family)|nr:SDR family oxidoreductase [Nitrospira sp.]
MPGIALVTGANKGLGLEVVRQLAAREWRVFLTGRSLASVRKAASPLGPSVIPVPLDVTSKVSIDAAFSVVSQTVDHLDVLINNAGILDHDEGSIFDLHPQRLRRMVETNTIGPLLVTQTFLPLLRKSQSGRIINVSSGSGQLSEMGTWAPAYSISKTALNGVTGQFAAALSESNIAVNSVCPGWVKTDMGGRDAPRSVEQGADTIVWLATEAPQTLTGRFIRDRKPIPW